MMNAISSSARVGILVVVKCSLSNMARKVEDRRIELSFCNLGTKEARFAKDERHMSFKLEMYRE